ncbi:MULTISPECIES: YjjG family noncanonical pyrimidine nucleotidase [Leuconostoc]|nr:MULTISPECIES: YjjG family noncanonical pyrimidine nucleotidase [Leuconostoc]AEJ30986.1 hydrolase, HAD superfamily protein [Leuconostoc sp. C2]QBR48082.1 noncanonical pyrimidine nucleotidase, YjjG family [Leuconostoc kimchii]
MIKNIIFDLDDTLLDFKRGECEGVRDILASQHVPDLEVAFEYYLALNATIWQKIEQGYDSQPLLNTRFSDTLAHFDIQSDGRQLEAMYRTKLDHNYHVISGATTLLDNLKKRGYKLIVGTNGLAKTQYARLAGANIQKYFDSIFISEEIGFNKPQPQFFSHILDVDPKITIDNTVMVGDKLSADIKGALAVNMKSIWFNPNNDQPLSTIKPTYIAQNYQDILDIVTT